MASRILLISINRCATPDPVFPLGLAHLNAALRAAGHETRWFDRLHPGPGLEAVIAEFRPDVAGISVRNIDDVVISRRETYFDELGAVRNTIRGKAGCPVVLGGSGYSIFPRELLEYSKCDFGIAGAGETSFVDLVDALEAKRSCSDIPGLAYWQDGAVVLNPPAAYSPPSPLGEADFPPELVDFYLKSGGMLNVQTQRGCSFHCTYCTYPVIEGRAHRRRSPAEVVEDFALAARVGAKYVFIVDSVFNSSPRHVHDICEEMIRRDLGLSWSCFLRPQGLTPELVRLMARAGLKHVEFGSDSFSDPVLKAYHKGFTFEEILESSRLVRQEKVEYCHFLICGGPGETSATLAEGFENSQRLEGPVIMAVVGMRIYPHTRLYAQALAEGRITPQTDLLEPAYYLAPGLTVDGIFQTLQGFARRSPSWIPGDASPEYVRLVQRLRSRGVVGPIWSYLAITQRLWPQTAVVPATP